MVHNAYGMLNEIVQQARLQPTDVQFSMDVLGWRAELTQKLRSGEELTASFVAGNKQHAKTEAARELLQQLQQHLSASAEQIATNHKGQLQQLLQVAARRGIPGWHGMPEYELVGAFGLDHQRMFRVKVTVSTPGGVKSAEGGGSSKKHAEQAAAGALLANDDLQVLSAALML